MVPSHIFQHSPLRYLLALSLPLTVGLSFVYPGMFAWLPLIYIFGVLPLLELKLKPVHENLSEEAYKELSARQEYDWFLYLMVVVQWGMLLWYLLLLSKPLDLHPLVLAGNVAGMGLMCGVLGINVGHELGHRGNKAEQILGQLALLSSLYMHFFIEHNRGHHRYVATPQDPATARFGESVYRFWLRSIVLSLASAWQLEVKRLQKKEKAVYSFSNQFLRFMLLQLALLLAIYSFFGAVALLGFIIAAILGILLLETVNYIEHYGLLREKRGEHYERPKPWHSWNSDHPLGRLMLFELSRHSDHHYLASRKYQTLRYHEQSPQMPTGYPGMMLVALVPPLWFRLMHPRLNQAQQSAILTR